MRPNLRIALATALAVSGSATALVVATDYASAAAESRPFPYHVSYKVGVLPSATPAARDAAVEKQYDSWKATYLVHGCATNEYYVSTKGDGDAKNDGPVSEGQGYGMNIVPLMAGYDANAKVVFDGLWQLVKDHEDGQGMMQWQLDGKTCTYYSGGTPDGATDGDIDIGYGLVLADKQWGGYTADAKNWLAHLYAADVASDGHLKVEDDDSNTFDSRPSDWMLDHLRAFAAYDTAHDWTKVVTKTTSLIQEFTAAWSPSAGFLSDFIIGADTTSPKPAPAKFQENQPDNIVGYNSIRVPWHLGTDALLYGDATSLATAKMESACHKKVTGGDPAKAYPHMNLDCTPRLTDGDGHADTQAEEAGDPVGPAAMAAGDQAWTDAIWNFLATNPYGDGYYGETIKTLVYIVMAGDYWSPADGVNPSPSPTASPTSPPGNPQAYEAEKATLGGGAVVNSCKLCSGGKQVTKIGKGGTVTFTSVAGSGSTTLTVYYQSPGSALTAVVTVNGTAQAVSFPATSGHTVGSRTVTVSLGAGGGNTIVFANPGAAAPNLDRIVV
jgi:endo-1,4-beta-D-glucanase Y